MDKGDISLNTSVRGVVFTHMLISKSARWKLMANISMADATAVSTLIEVQSLIRLFRQGRHLQDCGMFLLVKAKGRTVALRVPGAPAHAETDHLSSIVDWYCGAV